MVQLVLSLLSLVGVQLGHFLHVDAYTLAVKKHEVHRFDGRGHCGHEVTGDGLQNQLSCCLLWKTVPAAADGWKCNGFQLLIISQGQAVFHCLFQKFFTLVCTPDWTITVDHKLGRQAVTCAYGSSSYFQGPVLFPEFQDSFHKLLATFLLQRVSYFTTDVEVSVCRVNDSITVDRGNVSLYNLQL